MCPAHHYPAFLKNTFLGSMDSFMIQFKVMLYVI